MIKETKYPIKKFVPLGKKIEFLMVDHMSQQPARHMYSLYRGKKISSYKCNHYGRYGHIRSYCYRLYGYPQPYSQPRLNRKRVKNIQAKKLWKPKEITTSLTSDAYLRVSSR